MIENKEETEKKLDEPLNSPQGENKGRDEMVEGKSKKDKKKIRKKSINDYYELGNILISKKLVMFVVIIVLIVLSICFFLGLFLGRYLKGKSSLPVFYSGTKQLEGFSGEAEVILIPSNNNEDKEYNKAQNKNNLMNNKCFIYRGSVVKGKLNGYGNLYNEKNELVYQGEFKNNQMSGEGKYNEYGKLKYEGNFVNAKSCTEDNLFNGINGSGVIYYGNGNIKYKGSLLFGKPHGKGEAYVNDNQNSILYIGDFLNDKYDGYGILYNKNTNFFYEGEFKEGVCNGPGKLCDKKTGIKIFEGDFSNNSINFFSILGISRSDLESKFTANSEELVEYNYTYLTYKEIGATFVFDAPYVKVSSDSNMSKVVKIILWNYPMFTSKILDKNSEEFKNVYPIYSGYTMLKFEDRLALKNIDQVDKNKRTSYKSLNSIYISCFNYREYSLTTVNEIENNNNLYVIISR